MKPRNMMSMEHDQAQMWQLSADRRNVRMELPGLAIEGMPQLIKVKSLRHCLRLKWADHLPR